MVRIDFSRDWRIVVGGEVDEVLETAVAELQQTLQRCYPIQVGAAHFAPYHAAGSGRLPRSGGGDDADVNDGDTPQARLTGGFANMVWRYKSQKRAVGR